MASRPACPDHVMLSSSPAARDHSDLLSPPRRSTGKERRNPSITPRKFKRFFTPRSRVSTHISPARKALRELATPQANNLRYQTPAPSSPLRPPGEEDSIVDENETLPSNKRRKFQHTPDSSPCRPLQLPPLEPSNIHSQTTPSLLSPIGSLQSGQSFLGSFESDDEDNEEEHERAPVRRLAPLTSRGFRGQLMQRDLGALPRAGTAYMSMPAADWRMETADFYSRPEDAHSCVSHDGPGRCMPFCTAACHSNSLVAVGDEEGQIRLLDTAGSSAEPFSRIHLSFQAHSNAIIDLAFSSDDRLLATASGDQTGRVLDVMTQAPVAVLRNHTASLKQIRFQPGQSNNSVLATSSRDGSLQIWDLRCRGPVQEMSVSAPPDRDTGLGYRLPQVKSGCAVSSIYHAHARTQRQVQQAPSGGPGDMPSRGELPGRIGDVSVTALQFLPEGKEHLLLTGCEADASIKLWDIRSTCRKSKLATPISATAPPTSHSQWRPFGISSLSLNTDSTRLYALCKDNTVYAYSTSHLILGHAPELSSREAPRRRHGTHNGLGPLYGFRHPSLQATSFYVKCAVRPAVDGRSELLATGSSDACAVTFPTAERYFQHDQSALSSSLSLSSSTMATCPRPLSHRHTSSTNMRAEKDDIPIVRNGMPLIRGHDREVGALAWTNKGSLVTVADDYLVRCWREGREEAKDLRTGGEGEGRRWGCGWAEVGAWSGDESDDEE